MRRLNRIPKAVLTDDGAAAILTFEFRDVATGKIKLENIEVERRVMRDVLGATLAAAAAFGSKAPEPRRLPDTTLEQSLPMPSSEIAATLLKGSGPAILVRVGCQDLSLRFPDSRSCELLGMHLLALAKAARS